MSWTLRIAKRAQKEFAKAPPKSQRLLRAALEEMWRNPFSFSGDIARLTSERATWRRRVGAYRIFFDVDPDQLLIEVLDISRRATTTYRHKT
jgi:mRNA-degrading endonuclease RelE of RelBE toxin-antitoxin system